MELAAVTMSKQYAVREDLSADCLWEGLFPTVIEECDLKVLVFRHADLTGASLSWALK